ncbi:hypothetical protein M5K25_011434 [Dendrobium thyrsiflorum]|uniref:Uncharacterized protein n=1 Tax=Dendrobium thyrsiflorum TaxID=117978 RepID=A0ABD0V9M7_DENTH
MLFVPFNRWSTWTEFFCSGKLERICYRFRFFDCNTADLPIQGTTACDDRMVGFVAPLSLVLLPVPSSLLLGRDYSVRNRPVTLATERMRGVLPF